MFKILIHAQIKKDKNDIAKVFEKHLWDFCHIGLLMRNW